MKIDYSNAQIINSPDFCMHDDWFVNMNYECGKDTNTMNVHFIKYYKVKDYIVKFNNVIGFKGVYCKFWGNGLGVEPDIDCVSYNYPEEQTLLPRLYELKEKQLSIDDFCPLLSDEKFIEISLYFKTGDSLTIVCESLEVDDDMLKWGGDNS